jgi:outer membrane protein TolC
VKKRLGTAAILVCALFETHCIRYTPRPIVPSALESQFRNRSLNDPGLRELIQKQSGSAALSWPPSTFGLDALTLVALYFNPELNVARAHLATMEAAVISARQRINPSLSGSGGYNKTPESVTTYDVSPTFTIETAGRRGYRILEAEKLAEAARTGLYENGWKVRSQVRAALAQYHFATLRRVVLQAENEMEAETVEIFKKRVGLGEAARPDLSAMRAQQAATLVSLRSSEGEVEQTFAALATAVGLPVAALEGCHFDMTFLETPPAPESLPLLRVQQAGLLHRADIRRMLTEYEAGDARLRLELANQYPNIPLSPAYSFQEGFPAYTLGSVIDSLPVFHYHQGPIAEAEAAKNETKARFVALQAQAIGETESALRQYRAAVQEWIEARDHLAKVQEQRQAAVMIAFKAGEADRFDVTSARLFKIAADRAQMDALLRAQNALGALEDAVQTPLESGVNVTKAAISNSLSGHAQ